MKNFQNAEGSSPDEMELKHQQHLKEFSNLIGSSENQKDILSIYDIQIEYLYANGDYPSALDYSIRLYDQLKAEKFDSKEVFLRIRKEMIKCWNVLALKHLEKGENEKAKQFLETIDKFAIEDFSSYIATKTNLSCYYSNTNHFRNSKNVMSDIRRINIMKKLNDFTRETSSDINFERKDDPKSKVEGTLNNTNFTDIALDYHNICSIQNKLKNYHEGLLEGMQSVALNQFTCLMKTLSTPESAENKPTEKDIPEYNLIMAYYNMGVQQEFLNRLIDADISYKQSMSLAKEYGMDDHPLFKKLKSNKMKFNMNGNHTARSSSLLPPIKTSKQSTKRSHSTVANININFQETFTSNEMMMFKISNNVVEEKIHKIVNANEKLRSHPYYQSTSNNFFKKTARNEPKDFIF